jgi:predicted HD phosphohydrolase
MYAGEPVTQLEHAWQCGRLAEKSGASAPLQLASWLHDVGHLLVNGEGTPTLRGEDDAHELVGARLLLPLFGPAVSEPVRLHVLAKRYLVTTRESYSKKLSPDSVRSLEIQGGLMTAPACTNFEMQTFFSDALKLRVWDDLGKKMAWFDVTKNEALSHLGGLIDEVMSDRVTKI